MYMMMSPTVDQEVPMFPLSAEHSLQSTIPGSNPSDLGTDPAGPVAVPYMVPMESLPATDSDMTLDGVSVLRRSPTAIPSINRAGMPSPPSLDQDVDYFKAFAGQFLDPDCSEFMKGANLNLSPSLSLLSPASPFTALGASDTAMPRGLPLFQADGPMLFDELQPPTCEDFQNAYPDLDPTAFELLSYFQSQQSHIRSMSPLRNFRSIALIFSLRSRTNLLGILCWTAWHQGNQALAQKYFVLASEQLERNSSITKEELLVALLVLTSAKICSGQPQTWPTYLTWASNLLKRQGGVSSFMETETSRWLLSHFAYLDVLSVTSITTPKLLSSADLKLIFQRQSSPTLADSLCSCSEPLLLMIEKVNELSKSIRQAHSTGENLEELYNTAHAIEEQTWSLEPAVDKISHLPAAEQRLQIRQFDAFKLVAVLHLYQSSLCMNASATPIQVLSRRLLRTVEDLVDTKVSGMLVFPLFILGVNTANVVMRQRLVQHFERVFLRVHTRSVEKVKNLLFRIWRLDQDGSCHVDWAELVDQGFDFRNC